MRVFDAHLHIVDPRFPLVENDGNVQAPDRPRNPPRPC